MLAAPTTPAAREELWGIVLKYASLFRWLALGLLLFFLAAVAAETYLLCCLRDSKLKLTLRDGIAPWADPASLAARSGPQQPPSSGPAAQTSKQPPGRRLEGS